jgi:hypothetical protein
MYILGTTHNFFDASTFRVRARASFNGLDFLISSSGQDQGSSSELDLRLSVLRQSLDLLAILRLDFLSEVKFHIKSLLYKHCSV